MREENDGEKEKRVAHVLLAFVEWSLRSREISIKVCWDDVKDLFEIKIKRKNNVVRSTLLIIANKLT